MERDTSAGIPRFNREFFDAAETFTRIGSGGIGGKAAGLWLIRDRILSRLDTDEFPGFEVAVPTLTILATDLYTTFLDRNRLEPRALSELPDDRIAHGFQRAELPAEIVGDLRALIARVHTPLAVRSSSLLEDALEHPFAGVYATKMIPNNEIEEDSRFRRFIQAIKLVYSSTLWSGARSYLGSVGRQLQDERMAVVVQEVVGQRAADRFYPDVSGVARSYNYYPSGSARPEEGVVHLALGLGKTIVDGGLAWHYSPAAPKAPPPFNDLPDLLKNTQTRFWAVHMGRPPLPDPIRETECMVQPGLAEAEADGALDLLASTYDPGSDRLYPGLGSSGPRALTFAPLLGSRLLPFNELMIRLLELAREALEAEVEIEFALTFDRRELLPARLGLLQVRPMMVAGEKVDVGDHELSGERVLVATTSALGNGARIDIRDVVYIPPERFDPLLTPLMVDELETTNRQLADQARSYLLIGIGRWGTSDPSFGVPVAWGQISGARVIVEATLPDVNPDLSQGSHFFHNLLSFQILYLSVEHDGEYTVDWEWLAAQPAVADGRFIRHLRLDEPLDVRVDGAAGRGVILHDG